LNFHEISEFVTKWLKSFMVNLLQRTIFNKRRYSFLALLEKRRKRRVRGRKHGPLVLIASKKVTSANGILERGKVACRGELAEKLLGKAFSIMLRERKQE